MNLHTIAGLRRSTPDRSGRPEWARRHRGLALLLILVATAGGLGLPAAPANAAGAAQYLQLSPGLYRTVHVQFAHSHQCLHIPGQEPWLGRWLVQWPCDDESASRRRQYWEIRVANSGTDFLLRSPLTGLCANIDHAEYDFGTPIILWECASSMGTPFQNEFFKAGYDSASAPPADYFWFVPSQSTGWALNVDGGSTAPGAHVILWNLQKTAQNEWVRWYEVSDPL